MSRRGLRARFAVPIVCLLALAAPRVGAQGPGPVFEAGFGVRTITPVGPPPGEWAMYLTPNPVNGVWGEPFADLNGDGCMSGLTNHNLEPILDLQPPLGEAPEPHVDLPWNSLGDGQTPGPFEVRGVRIVGDPQSTGKWDGLWGNAGFGSRCATGKKDETWARAVVLRHGDTTVAMVSLDVVGFFNVEIRRAREEMRRRYPDMAVDELVVSSTHTHEGVDTMGFWGQLYLSVDGKFPAYQAYIRSQILDAVHDAYQNLQPARVKLARTQHTVGVRDSRPPNVIDPYLYAAQFVGPDDSTIGTIVNWSNHPEAQGSNNGLVSSDFVHGARVELEGFYRAPAVYFSGSVGGLMTPLGANVPGFGTAESWERTYEIGRLVGVAAEQALAAAPVQDIPSLDVQTRHWYMDLDNTVLRALNAIGIFDVPSYVAGESWGPPEGRREGVYAGYAGAQLRTEMVAVRMGPAVFLTVPGELFPELEVGGFGRTDCPQADTGRPHEPAIAAQFAEPFQFVLGLAQDELGYIVPGYDFWLNSVPQGQGSGVVPVGGLEAVDPCGEGHYEETVSASSVMAPWVTCVARELAGRDPLSEPACAYDNMHTLPYGLKP